MKKTDHFFVENKTIYRNSLTVEFDMQKVWRFIEDELRGYTCKEKKKILEYIGFLVSDLDVTGISMKDIPERYYFEAVYSYLKDGHTVKDLELIDDDSVIFEYCGGYEGKGYQGRDQCGTKKGSFI